jgi:transposase
MSPQFAEMYSHYGRPSIAPERLLRALLLQVLYSGRRERRGNVHQPNSPEM